MFFTLFKDFAKKEEKKSLLTHQKQNLSVIKIKVMLEIVAKGDPKALFSIATTPRCRGGCYSFPCIVPLNSWSVSYNAEC